MDTMRLLSGEALFESLFGVEAVPFEEAKCCGRKPCRARRKTPGQEGWLLFQTDHPRWSDRNGWWCPECVDCFQEVAAEQGIPGSHHDVVLNTGLA
jgi:hypothetical protein